MPSTDLAFWTDQLRQTLERYDESLLRQVAGKLFKPRNQWPVGELIERSMATLDNAAVIDRRLKELEPAERRVLALIGHSRQPRWRLGNLVEMLIALGHTDGVPPILKLFEVGFLYPHLPERLTRLKSFEQWLGQAGTIGMVVFAHPQITARALGEDLGLPDLSERVEECESESAPEKSDPTHTPSHSPTHTPSHSPTHEADGLEWPLRLSVLWQIVSAGPLRRTQQGDFFKRDLERLSEDPLLCTPPADSLAPLPDAGLLAVALAEIEGIVLDNKGELHAGELPASWDEGPLPLLASLWAALPCLDAWNPLDGWRGPSPSALGNPYPSASLLALLLLARLPEGFWTDPVDLETWVLEHHPYWTGDSVRPSQQRSWLPVFLLGFVYQLRMLQAVKDGEGRWLVRLSPTGRWLLGLGETPPAAPLYPQTLLVQPNLEIIAYRQGLSPGLIAQLARFAAWKNLGAACLLQLQPESVYRALQAGQTFQSILQTLERHGTRALPPSVVDSLRTWADKRERITIYPSATLFEFASADDANEALARGLPGTRVADRLIVVPSENGVDFRHFRLTGTRDYSLPPEKCVEVDEDGVSLSVDLARSDLLVETELQRFAEPSANAFRENRRLYRMTPASIAASRERGMTLRDLEEWFLQRTGQTLSAAGRLLLNAGQFPPGEMRRQLVLHVITAEVADGLLQWPGTRGLIEDRLGPTTLVVAEENVGQLREKLGELGLSVKG